MHEADFCKIQNWIRAKIDVNVADYDMRTPLHVAVSFNQVDTANLLVKNGAKSSRDRFGNVPLDDAKREGNAAQFEDILRGSY